MSLSTVLDWLAIAVVACIVLGFFGICLFYAIDDLRKKTRAEWQEYGATALFFAGIVLVIWSFCRAWEVVTR